VLQLKKLNNRLDKQPKIPPKILLAFNFNCLVEVVKPRLNNSDPNYIAFVLKTFTQLKLDDNELNQCFPSNWILSF